MSEGDRTWVLAHLTEPILVASVTSYEAPYLPALGADYHRGSRSGVVYLVDIDGALLYAQMIARDLERWRVSAVVARVAAPPSLDTLQLLDPCDVRVDGLWRYRVGDVETAKAIVAIPAGEFTIG